MKTISILRNNFINCDSAKLGYPLIYVTATGTDVAIDGLVVDDNKSYDNRDGMTSVSFINVDADTLKINGIRIGTNHRANTQMPKYVFGSKLNGASFVRSSEVVDAPDSLSAFGLDGWTAYDSDYFYYCYEFSAWRKIAYTP